MQHGRKKPQAGKARRARLGTVFADGSALLTGPDGTVVGIVEARTPYRVEKRKRAAKKKAHRLEAQADASVDKVVAGLLAQAMAPELTATPATLKEVWERWHTLPKSLSDDERSIALLTANTYLFPDTITAAVRLLRRHFGPPLDEQQYATSVEAAHWWSGFREYLERTLALGDDFLRANLAFKKLDEQAPGRVAAYRTRQEVLSLRSTILDQESPSLADVELVRSTHDAYLEARQQAQQLLNQILYPRAIQRGSEHLDACVLLDLMRSRRRIRVMDAQAIHDAPILMPRPPEKLPRHLQIAMLAAQRKGPRVVSDFMATRFLELPKAKRDEFLQVFDHPPALATRCGSLAPWLADNAPLLRRLKAQWNDVQSLAEAVFPKAELPANLRNFAEARTISLGFKPGANYVNREGLTTEFITPLLSPPPQLALSTRSA